jgi:hypothetical protein
MNPQGTSSFIPWRPNRIVLNIREESKDFPYILTDKLPDRLGNRLVFNFRIVDCQVQLARLK